MAPVRGLETFFQLSLLGLVTSGFLAVAGSGLLDWPTVLLTSAGLLLRAALVTRLARFRLPDRLVTALTIAYIGFYPIDLQFISREFLPATVHLIFFLAVIKILTAKTARDDLFAAVISLVELLAGALISVQLNFFACLGAYLLFAVAALSSGEIRRSAAQPAHLARRGSARRISPRLAALAVILSAGILFMTAGLFFLLPRTAHAALRRLVTSGYYLPGFSNQVTLGQIGEIKLRSNVVMHARFYPPTTRHNARWRGAALAEFDGRRWFNASNRGEILRAGAAGTYVVADDDQRRRPGRRLVYRVDLKALDTDTLFFTGLPEVVVVSSPLLIRTPAGGYRLGTGATGGVRYDVHAFNEDQIPGALPRGEAPRFVREQYLRLPLPDSRIPALARELTAGETTALARARALEQHLRRDYRYTTKLLPKEVPDPLAYFLFERREGHCEYFASAMAVMLRLLNIPSRLVTGFLGGTYNPISGMYVVRASDAHSWVEAWIPGHGWIVFDPTPPDPNPEVASVWSRLSLYFDAADTFWQEWVLSYDLGRQLFLADQMERSSRFGLDWLTRPRPSLLSAEDRARLKRWALPVALALVAGALAMVLGPILWRRLAMRLRLRRLRQGQASVGDATQLYLRFLDLLRRRGYSKPPWYTPAEFVATLRDPAAAALAGRFTSAYLDLRFGGKLEAAPRLSLLLDELEALRR